MKTWIVAAAIAVSAAITPVAAQAQERVGDGLLGAAAGAAVGGPVGAVVGGVVGFTNGPHIARGLGVRPCYNHCLGYYPRHHYYHNYAYYHHRHYYR
jgi:hypothetical protein